MLNIGVLHTFFVNLILGDSLSLPSYSAVRIQQFISEGYLQLSILNILANVVQDSGKLGQVIKMT